MTREELFVTSKLWNSFHAKEHVKAAAKKSLADLGLDYFDLYLMHFPIALKYVDPEVRYPPGWLDETNEKVNSIPRRLWTALIDHMEGRRSKRSSGRDLGSDGRAG